MGKSTAHNYDAFSVCILGGVAVNFFLDNCSKDFFHNLHNQGGQWARSRIIFKKWKNSSYNHYGILVLKMMYPDNSGSALRIFLKIFHSKGDQSIQQNYINGSPPKKGPTNGPFCNSKMIHGSNSGQP